jgi:hypothetical protein
VVCYSGGRFLRYDRKDRHIEIIWEEKPGEILDQKRILLLEDGWGIPLWRYLICSYNLSEKRPTRTLSTACSGE